MNDNLQENQQKDLLGDVGMNIDTTEYDAKVRKARNWLFVVAAVQLIAGIAETAGTAEELQTYVMIVHGIIVAIFVALAFWSNKRAYEALITAIIIYVAIYIAGGFLDPMNFIRGILIKVFVIIALVNGIKAAKEAKALRGLNG